MGRLSSSDVSLADFTTEVTKKTMEKAGIKIVDNGEFVLSGKILALDPTLRSGFWSASLDSAMHGEIQISKNGVMLDKTSFIEKGTADATGVITDSFEGSLNNMFRNLSTTIMDFVESSTRK